MFSLIITLVAIALVVILVLATIYYGGSAFGRGAVKTSALTIVNQSIQIAAAGDIAVAQGRTLPEGATVVIPEDLLKSMPIPPANAYISGEPAATDWAYYLPGQSRHFGLDTKVKQSVCMEINRQQGFIGVPAAWDGSSRIQCFGPTDSGYTYLYEPGNQTQEQHDTALQKSVDDAKVTVPTATPGYPRLCPDGSTLEAGLCAPGEGSGGDGSGGGGTTPSTAKYSLYSFLGAQLLDGSSVQTSYNVGMYCSIDTPHGVVTAASTMTVGGVDVPIDDFDDSFGTVCIYTYGMPAHDPGTLPIIIKNPNGSTIEGNARYIEAATPTPTRTAIWPASGRFDESTTVIVSGEGFEAGVQVSIRAYHLQTTFIDSSHVRIVVPPMSTFYPDGHSLPAALQLYLFNPDSASSYDYTYFSYHDVVQQSGGLTATPNQAYVDGSSDGAGGQSNTMLCPSSASPIFQSGAYVTFGAGAESFERTLGTGPNANCLSVPIPAAKQAGASSVAVRVVDTVNFTPDVVYSTPITYLPMGGATKALKISGMRVVGGTMTFTVVDDCSAVTGLDICLPAFTSTSASWTWPANNVTLQFLATDTTVIASNRMRTHSIIEDRHYGFTITDGAHSYTVTDQEVFNETFNSIPAPLNATQLLGNLLINKPGGGVSLACSDVVDALTTQSEDWDTAVYDCTSLETNAAGTTWTYNYEDYGDTHSIEVINDYTLDVDCTESDNQCTFHAASSVTAEPFYIGVRKSASVSGGGTRVRAGIYLGLTAAWPAAPNQ